MQAIEVTYTQLVSHDTLTAYLRVLRDRKELSISHAKGLEIVGELHRDLLHHRYSHRPCRLRTVNINGKRRDLDTPQVRDMVLQSAWNSLVSQAVEKQFSKHSFGFRPNLSCHKALIELKSHLEVTGKRYALKADIHKFFDCIPRLELIRILKTLIQDQDLLRLTVSIIETAETFKGMSSGLPTGWPMNPLLANIYLHSVDRYIEGLGIYFLRYADDIIVPAETMGQATIFKGVLSNLMERLGLSLSDKPGKTASVNLSDGVDFLGHRLRLDEESLRIFPKLGAAEKMHVEIMAILERPISKTKMSNRIRAKTNGWNGCTRFSKASFVSNR